MSSTPPSEEPKTNSTPPSDFGWNLNQTLNQLIGFADTKAGALLAAAVVIFALLLSSKPTLSLSGIIIMYALALFCLALCAVCAGFAFFPFIPFRIRGNNRNPVFWKWIQRQQLDYYQELVS